MYAMQQMIRIYRSGLFNVRIIVSRREISEQQVYLCIKIHTLHLFPPDVSLRNKIICYLQARLKGAIVLE